jgi:putative oxidoreductase
MRMNQNTGVRLFRYTLGTIFVFHGLMKFAGGLGTLTYIGAMPPCFAHLNPHIQLVLGLIAATIELVGGLCVITGRFFRYACGAIALTMLAAATYHVTQMHDFDSVMCNTWPLEDMFVFLAFLLIGPSIGETKKADEPKQ